MFFIRGKFDKNLRRVEYSDFVQTDRVNATGYHTAGEAALDLLKVVAANNILHSRQYEIVEEVIPPVVPTYRVIV